MKKTQTVSHDLGVTRQIESYMRNVWHRDDAKSLFVRRRCHGTTDIIVSHSSALWTTMLQSFCLSEAHASELLGVWNIIHSSALWPMRQSWFLFVRGRRHRPTDVFEICSILQLCEWRCCKFSVCQNQTPQNYWGVWNVQFLHSLNCRRDVQIGADATELLGCLKYSIIPVCERCCKVSVWQ